MIPRYAGVGVNCPEWDVSVVSGGSLTTDGTIYFAFQLMNRAGLNRAFISSAIDYAQGDRIEITIPESIRSEAYDIHYFILSASTTSNPENFIQIARLPGYQYGEGTEAQSIPTPLPATIDITKDEHLLIAPNVLNAANLPSGVDLIDGMVRWVIQESRFVEYQAEFDTWGFLGSPNTFILDTTIDGSDRNLTQIDPTEVIPHPVYPPAPNIKVLPDWESKYCLYNNSSNPLPAGTEFGIELSYNNKRSPDLLNGLFLIKFDGFVDGNGNLRTTDSEGRDFNNIGGFVSWEPKIETPFVTDDDLRPGESIFISVKPFFSTAELNNQVPDGAVIGILPVIRTQSGNYNPIADLIDGDVVFAKGDYYRVLPSTGLSFIVTKGMALVGSYSFPVKPQRTVSGLQEDTANQQVIINGNGAVYLESLSYQPTSSEALRALISTVAGESVATEWSDYVEITNGGISVSVIISNIIREDYPDVIKGTAAQVNAPAINIYLQRLSDTTIRKFGSIPLLPENGFEYTIGDWNDGVNAALPAVDESFSLFAPGEVTLVEDVGILAVDSYRAAVTYAYEGAEITSISHSSPPCIQEYPGDFSPPEINIISTTTINAGENASVIDVNPLSNISDLEFYLPKGITPSLIGGEGEILPPHSSPVCKVVPTEVENEYQIIVDVPRGLRGERGIAGAKGDTGEPGEPGSIGSASAAGAINLDESTGTILSLDAEQIALRNINQELIVEDRLGNQINYSTVSKLFLISNLK